MALYNYALAVGHDQTALTNVEDLLTTLPIGGIKGQILPLGSVRERTLNQYVRTSGTIDLKWFFPALPIADFDTLITTIFGDYATENALLTIDTRASDNNFHRGNVVCNRPLEGVDYTRREFGNVEDLTLTLRDFQEVADSGFSIGFDIGFTS